ncbi:hypothetical protein BX659_1501 [Orenia metallireducens]|jgi:intergrase/recombinase|uniref:hypothetical protein n=1 Tax=Orenia metallireducens TaxID=1413210 RepID=UPI000D07650F|nr:hypothetical protein [Orenia metallireducens]PRX17500.1 hypothetical protein BX659_1501 [Orenia metallireducens]
MDCKIRKQLIDHGFEKEEVIEMEQFIDFYLSLNKKEKKSCIKIMELMLETGLRFDDICFLVEHIEKDCLKKTAL